MPAVKILAVTVPLLIAVFGFATSRIFVTRRQRLRSSIEADMALWKTLPYGDEKDAFLGVIKSKVRQLVSEEGDLAYGDRLAGPVLIAFALVGGLFASAALLGNDPGGLWWPAGIFVGAAAVGGLGVTLRTLGRLRAAHRGDPVPPPPPPVSLWRWFRSVRSHFRRRTSTP